MSTTHPAPAAQDGDATEDGPEYFRSYTEEPGWEDVDAYADCTDEEVTALEAWLRSNPEAGRRPAWMRG